MRRTSFLTSLWLTLALPIAAAAQPAPEPEPEPEEPGTEEATPAEEDAEDEAEVDAEEALDATDEDEAAEEDEEAAPQLEPPQLGPLNVPPPPAVEPAPEPELEPELPDPAEAADLLEETDPEVEKDRWTLPEPVFSLNGYFRLRANVMRKLALGRTANVDRLQSDDVFRANIDPFDAFRPGDSTDSAPEDPDAGSTVVGGCGKNPGADGLCDRNLQVSSDLRLRLKPEIALGDDVRVKMWIDVFDNVAFGTADRNPRNRIDLGDTITARRAWGEVRDRDLGELRFGRMGADWGLGILDNGGDRNGIDSDFSSEVDRVMAITNLGGFYLMGAYDWASQGAFIPGSATPSGVPLDFAQKDDLNEITLAVSRRKSPEQEEAALARGDAVFNAGTYFVWRKQLLRLDRISENEVLFERLNEKQFIPDLWLQLKWQGLRVELEAAFVAGTIEGGCPQLITPGATPAARNEEATEELGPSDSVDEGPGVDGGTCKLRQLGAALETEYRLIDDRLGIYFYSGFASGDQHAYGLASTNNPSQQRVANEDSRGDDTISTYGFHPDYRVDLILWRNVMGAVAGGYYFKPGISFDFLRNPFGQRLGGKFDIIYSRASAKRQTWGLNSNLGVEMDLSLYYRSEDGPDPMDGFYAMADYGVLFPLKGMSGLEREGSEFSRVGGDIAMMFRTVLGIAF